LALTVDDPTATAVPRGGGLTTGDDIVLSSVAKSFGPVPALAGVDLEIAEHARVAVVGPSGCGKSTLLSIVAGLLVPDTGSVSVGGASAPPDRLARCALMPQRDLLLPWRSALDNAALALANRGVSREEARRRTRPLFDRFGLGEFADAAPHELSGGMRQRVAFLRTLMAGKDVLLLDEPFGALDAITRAEMQEWLRSALDREPRTVLLVTHDVEEALLLADEVIVLSSRPGRVMARLESGFPHDTPRRELVTSPEFATLKERALEALEC
jgi:NitT/TauT family transport system ATP-binding protein